MPLNPEKLKLVRTQKGFSQDELAKRIGVHKSQLFRYEKGENDPTSTVLTALAQELDVSIDYLTDLAAAPKGNLGDTLQPDESQLLEAYRAGDARAIFEIVTDRLRKLPR